MYFGQSRSEYGTSRNPDHCNGRRGCHRRASQLIVHISSVQASLARRRWEKSMKLPRRTFLRLAAGAAALPAVSRIARAQAYPTRPVRLVVGFAAGGTQDVIARLIGPWLSERLGQQIVIENRAGASSNIAAEAVIRLAARRLHAVHGRSQQRDQRLALRQAQLRFRARHRPGRWHPARAQCHGSGPGGSGRDPAAVHRLRQGQSRQDKLRIGRRRNLRARLRRAVQDDDGREHGARALSRRGAGADRSSSPGKVR